MTAVVLPELSWAGTPNESARTAGAKARLVVLHRWGVKPAETREEAVSRLAGTVAYLRKPEVEVSAHVVYGGSLCPASQRAVQLVKWDRKAWTQAALNSVALSIECADGVWEPAGKGKVLDEPGLAQVARMTGWLCLHGGVPAVWASGPEGRGIARHLDLGELGNPNGHSCPTTDTVLWRRFVSMVRAEVERGGYRKSWGRGRLPW